MFKPSFIFLTLLGVSVSACSGADTDSTATGTNAAAEAQDLSARQGPDVSTCPANAAGKLNICHDGTLLSLPYAAASQFLSEHPSDYLGTCVLDGAAQTPAWVIAISSATTVATLRWAAVPGVTSYRVYSSTDPCVTRDTSTFATVQIPPGKPTGEFTQKGLVAGASYYYIVTALNNVGEGRETPIQKVTTGRANILPPQSVAGTPLSGGTNEITSSLVSGASSYALYYSKTPGVTPENASTTIATQPETHTTFRFDNFGRTPGVTYYYVLAGVANGQAGPPSTEIAVTAIP
jgi:hypothetical protein